MLKKTNRLTRLEIESLIKTGKNIYSPLFSGRLGNSLSNFPKASFVVSKKVFPLAVNRNKAKRRAREAFRRVFKEIKPVQVVFFLKKPIATAKSSDISLEFHKILKK